MQTIRIAPWCLFPLAVDIVTTMLINEVPCDVCQCKPVPLVLAGIWRRSILRFLTDRNLMRRGYAAGNISSYSCLHVILAYVPLGAIREVWIGVYITRQFRI